ncbi:MAG: hypothetical protein RLZZ303_1493, partial [Candidatus Hydrogenedentota bacterium]
MHGDLRNNAGVVRCNHRVRCSSVERMSRPPAIETALAGQLLSRRGFLSSAYTGLAAVGLTGLLSREAAASVGAGLSRLAPHHAPRARRVLQIFCPGAAS